MGGDRKYVVARDARAANKPKAARLNSRHQLGFNVITLAGLDGTATVKTDFLGFEPLDDANRYAVDHVIKGTDGAVALKRSKSERTGSVSFGPVLADRPDLKVEKGRLRMIPWTIDPDSGRFILELAQEENIPAPVRTTKKKVDSNTHPTNL
jgi:hypothetical protein